MRMDKLTTNFQQALADAQSLAVGRDHQFIEPVHVLSALLEQRSGSVLGILTKAGANLNLLRSQLGDALDRLPSVQGAPGEVHIGNEQRARARPMLRALGEELDRFAGDADRSRVREDFSRHVRQRVPKSRL